jgi:chromosome partitioning protein
MIDYEKIGITQQVMSRLSRVNPSTISRSILNSGILPLSSASNKMQRYSISSSRKILNEYFVQAKPTKNKILSFYNFKGGTGKTSVCFQVCAHLAVCGYKVLAVDADPQGHLSTYLGFNGIEQNLTLHDVLIEGVEASKAIKPVFEGLDCIPSDLSLTRIALPLDQLPKREEVVQRYFENLRNKYDYIIFDTNPTISTLNRNIIVFSDLLNIVCETQPLSMHGLKLLLEDLDKFCKIMRIKIPQIFIIPNKYEDRSGSSAEAMAALRQFYSEYLKEDYAIRRSEDINTSAKTRLPLCMFAKSTSNALQDIIDLIHELIDRTCIKSDMLFEKL